MRVPSMWSFIALLCGPAKTKRLQALAQMLFGHAYVGKVQITRTSKLVHYIVAESMRCYCFQLKAAIDLKCIVNYP